MILDAHKHSNEKSAVDLINIVKIELSLCKGLKCYIEVKRLTEKQRNTNLEETFIDHFF